MCVGGSDASEYVIQELPSNLPTEHNANNDPVAVSHCAWSSDCRYMASRCESMPRVLWIWDTTRLGLAAVLVQRDPITQAKWTPREGARLALCTGGTKVYLWSPRGCSCVDIPSAGVEASQLGWSQCGRYMVVSGARALCVCYVENVEF